MEVYVEYAFLENFCVDAALLFLSFKISKNVLPVKGLIFGGLVGAAFAIVYPFLPFFFGKAIAEIIKFLFPLFIVFVGYNRRVLKNGRGRYVLNVLSFYLVSFAFAGGVYAVCGFFSISYAYGGGIVSQVPLGLIFSVGVAFFAFFERFCRRLYARKIQTQFLYPCEIVLGEKCVKTQGLLDSGNVARKNGIPVCFLSADIFYRLFLNSGFGLAQEELAITTVSGNKKIKLFFLDEIRIYSERGRNIIKNPYCALNAGLTGREYKVLLGAWALDGQTEEREKRGVK